MSKKTEISELEVQIRLYDRTQFSLAVHAVSLLLTWQDNELSECCFIFKVSPLLYQHIDREELFSLKQEVRQFFSRSKFLPNPEIQIEVCLKPDLLPCLAKYVTTIDQAAAYLLTLNQEQPDNPLLCTESWLALSVKQLQESGEVGYSTLWAYITPQALAQAASSDSSEEISGAIANFFRDWTEANLSAVVQKAASATLDGITHSLNQVIESSVDTFIEAVASNEQIFEAIVNFFKEDGWSFLQIEEKPILQLGFQGKNGELICRAVAREEQQQFVFYSLCLINAPEEKRGAIAEFVTRANYCMIIGNFELDLDNGEIRYKTSIDVEGDRLFHALIKQLVYTNVLTMDQYLPGIIAVIEQGMEPKEAIALVES